MPSLLLRGGTIVPADVDGRVVDALALRGGRIIAVGEEDEVARAAGTSARVVDLEGRSVLPGLIDTHPHLMHFATVAESCVDLADAADHEEIVRRIAAVASARPAGDWIVTSPIGEPHYFIRRSWRDLAEGELPDRHVLDRGASAHPVMISAWAPVIPNALALNSAALERVGIDRDTPEQIGDVSIEKDPEGVPTGRLFGSVTNYYSGAPFTEELLRKIPTIDAGAIGPGTERAVREFNAMGVTAAYEGHLMPFSFIDAYGWLRAENRLRMRVLCSPEAQPFGLPWFGAVSDEEFNERLARATDLVQRKDDLLRIDGVTLSPYGSCFAGMTRMRELYEGPYGEQTRGIEVIHEGRIVEAIKFCARRNLRLNLVIAGLAEFDRCIPLLEKFGAGCSAAGRAWILQNLYFVEPEQAESLAALDLDLTTSMSFSWGKGEMVRERLGERFLQDFIPLKRLIDAGLHVACGSDWGPKNIFEQMALAVEPRHASGTAGATPGITPAQSLATWTREAAHVIRWSDIGSLVPGAQADLCIVDRNPLECSAEELAETQVLCTALGGAVVHGQLDGLEEAGR